MINVLPSSSIVTGGIAHCTMHANDTTTGSPTVWAPCYKGCQLTNAIVNMVEEHSFGSSLPRQMSNEYTCGPQKGHSPRHVK